MTTAVSLAQSVAPGVSLGFKNRIINGNMTIDQRNAGASVTPTNGQYTLDRWAAYAYGSATGKFTVQQNAGSVTPPTGFTNYLGATSTSAYSVASGDITAVYQIVEGYNVSDLGFGTASAKTVTLSFLVRSSLTGTFGGSLRNASANRSYPFTYTISAANTWETKTVTVSGDTSGTWNTTNGQGLFVHFGLGVGSTYSGTAGSWASADYYSATGATSVVGTNGATFYITGVQLEVGTAATSFEFRDYGRELLMCQRYYEQLYYGSSGYSLMSAPLNSTANHWLNWTFSAQKRTVPTVGLNTGTWASNAGVTVTAQPSKSSVQWNGSGGTDPCYFYGAGTANNPAQYASAEL